ncbi:histidine kinase N-terminal 7TM domain-containing protein [Saccharibacillus sp. CPCC 101409]|uniref:histidine kinase N-terminal 7TM domain-containing diguanylate cyclase n=1 Tax=Saccharibacillus sp. CPCC 101409 TaxID=3058041 RepID=UPI002671A3A6|nr:histidine kinase N-terminal 7TM domain-containing protein [Saccharibacillus sp. CPCC 101409]MDO3410074.1 histidine kinase N-terminal 7TM domain-containing protein [Saccharibacillus sp. CPCC 101409]
MNTAFSTFIVLFAISGVLSILLALYAGFQKTRFSGMRWFVLMSAATALYTFGSSFELASTSLREIKFWISIEYLGLPFISALNLIVVLHYIGREKMLASRKTVLLLILPAITTLLMLTNDRHGLVYQGIQLREGTPWPLADITMGLWYVVNGSYTLGCGLVGMWLLARHMRQTLNVYRKQTATMFVGLLLPIGASLVYVLNLTPFHIDPVPAVMSLTNILYCWAILSAGMLTSTSVIRENILDSMRDGVIVIDPAGRIADYNKAASQLFPFLNAELIGENAAASFPRERLHGRDADMSFLEDDDRQIEWMTDLGTHYYRIRSTPVYRRGGAFTGRTVVVLDVTENVLLHRKLERLATHDGLTQIYNRAYFVERSEDLVEETRRAGRPLCFALLDIDRFKSINDGFGHDVGDLVIRHVVHACKIYLGDRDVFGRYGGEEFALCLPDRTIEEAYGLLECVRRELASGPLMTESGPIGVTASFGLVEARPGEPLGALTKMADQAMYRAKRSGRNAVRIAGEDDGTRHATRISSPAAGFGEEPGGSGAGSAVGAAGA